MWSVRLVSIIIYETQLHTQTLHCENVAICRIVLNILWLEFVAYKTVVVLDFQFTCTDKCPSSSTPFYMGDEDAAVSEVELAFEGICMDGERYRDR